MQTTKAKAPKGRCHVRLLGEYCKGCGLCVGVCPKRSLVISRHLNSMGYSPVEVREGAECTGCCNCAVMCPDAAIEIVEG